LGEKKKKNAKELKKYKEKEVKKDKEKNYPVILKNN
jgi:hypothetical protein